MNVQNDRHIDGIIGRAMDDQVPAEVEERLRSQLAGFRTKLGTAEKHSVRQSVVSNLPFRLGAVATGLATIALIAVIFWGLRPRVSLADVAAAVLEKPWIHVTVNAPGGKTYEEWYSPTKDISAERTDEWLDYRDHATGVYYSYDLAEEVLYRVPEYNRRSKEHSASMTTTLLVMLQDERPVDKPLERMGFLGDKRTELEIVEQKLEKIEENGQKWLDYQLTVRHHEQPEPIQMLFRVDAETKLLRLTRLTGCWEGKDIVREERFDYPEKGPVDIYDLGTPKTAKLVDRVPSDDIRRILATIRAGRQRMDNYRAVFVRRTEGINHAWWREDPMIMYRKGDKFRADFARGRLSEAKKPADDEDMAAWWLKRANDYLHCPQVIQIGSVQYSINVKNGPGSELTGPEYMTVESVEKRETNDKPGETYPPYWSWRPEFVCRPPLGIPSQQFEPVIDLNPSEGPSGTILLRVRASGRMPGNSAPHPDNLPPPPDAYRYWLDPARDYVVVRSEMLSGSGQRNEVITNSDIVEELAESPQGVWYVTRFRQPGLTPASDGKTHDQLLFFYLDFNADLPDSLFEPPKRGHVYRY